MINFSLILPSRERPQLLREFLQSVVDTAERLDELEVLVALDDDNAQEYQDVIQETSRLRCGGCASYFLRSRQEGTTPYYNFLAGLAEGKYIWVLNDDCVLTTPSWDKRCINYLFNRTPERPGLDHFEDFTAFYGRTRDNLGAKKPDTGEHTFAMFPLLSRKAYESQGWVLNPKFKSWGADENLYSIWSGLGRVVDLSMMRVDHRSFHHGTRQRDEVSERMGKMSNFPYSGPEEQKSDIAMEIERIRRILDEVPAL